MKCIFMKNERGSFAVLAALVMVAVCGFAALSIDVGYMLTAKNQLQNAVDAAALAGASGLTAGQTEAKARAIQYAHSNDCMKVPVQLSPSDVSFPASVRVRVQSTRALNLFFARVLGMNSANVTALAAAEIGQLVGTRGLKPWAVPDLGWPIGAPVIIKAGSVGAPATNPSYFYPIDFPPLNRGTPVTGAKEYEKNIITGSDGEVFIGDVIKVEPGNMVGPTQQGVMTLINADPGAYWDGQKVAGSRFPEETSPRIVKIPFYDPNFPPNSGRKNIGVYGLGAFFISSIQGGEVTAIFLHLATSGTRGSGNTMLYGVYLVQ